MLDVHARLIRSLEQAGGLDRALEFLPERRGDRRAQAPSTAGSRGPSWRCCSPTRKIDLYAELLDSDLPEDPYLSARARGATSRRRCPSASPSRCARTGCGARSSRRRSSTTSSTARGTTFVFRLREETGAPAADIARAYAVAREVFEMRPLWAEIEALDNRSRPHTQIAMLLEGRRLVERATRWLLRNRRRPLDIAATVELLRARRDGARDALPGCSASDVEPLAWRARTSCARPACRRAGGARRPALSTMFSALDIVEVARETGSTSKPVAARALPARRPAPAALAARPDRRPCRATTAGRRSRARRCATTSTACTGS